MSKSVSTSFILGPGCASPGYATPRGVTLHGCGDRGKRGMLSDRERQEVEAQVNRDCAQFEIIMTDIIDAGFDGSNPFLWLHDADGRPWHKAPYKMSPADIETYLRHRFPEIFLTFLRALPVMTVH